MRDCPPGYFCEANTENYLNSPCEKGTTRAEPRGVNQGSCSDCPAGHYCLEEEPAPIACPEGTFHGTGADSVDSTNGSDPCTACTAGYKCPHPAMAAPYECGSGYYSQEGAQTCTLCQTGYICDTTTTTATAYEANKCDGYNCEIFADEIYEKSDCREGHYCPSDSKVQIPCPRGTYRDAGGLPTAVTDCLDAP